MQLQHYRYEINHFSVSSALPLPCRDYRHFSGSTASISQLEIRFAPGRLREFPSVHWICQRHGRMLRAYDVGGSLLLCGDTFRLHVHGNGEIITLDFKEHPFDQLESLDQAMAAEIVRAYTAALTVNLGLSFCTLLQGNIPLHGTLLDLDGRLIGILAPSGIGKSTLLWALLDQGACFGSDDVFPIHQRAGRIIATPSISLHAKLSRKTLDDRELDWKKYQEAIPGGDEFWIPFAPEERVMEPRPLDALFVLRPTSTSESSTSLLVQRVVDGAAVALLMENTQGLWAASSVLDGTQIFRQYTAVVSSVPIFSLQYSRSRAILPILIAAMRELTRSSTSNT